MYILLLQASWQAVANPVFWLATSKPRSFNLPRLIWEDQGTHLCPIRKMFSWPCDNSFIGWAKCSARMAIYTACLVFIITVNSLWDRYLSYGDPRKLTGESLCYQLIYLRSSRYHRGVFKRMLTIFIFRGYGTQNHLRITTTMLICTLHWLFYMIQKNYNKYGESTSCP